MRLIATAWSFENTTLGSRQRMAKSAVKWPANWYNSAQTQRHILDFQVCKRWYIICTLVNCSRVSTMFETSYTSLNRYQLLRNTVYFALLARTLSGQSNMFSYNSQVFEVALTHSDTKWWTTSFPGSFKRTSSPTCNARQGADEVAQCNTALSNIKLNWIKIKRHIFAKSRKV